MAYVYRHIRLDKNQPFYIGVGTKDDGKYERSRCETRNNIWKSISKKSKYKIEIMIDDISPKEAYAKEIELISLYGRIDLKTGILANLTIGGEGNVGFKHTDESKIKISKSGKGSKRSAETATKISLARKGIKFSEDHLKNMSLAKIGKKQSAELIEKRTLSIRGLKRTPEQKAKLKGVIGKWMIGKTWTPEMRVKMSLRVTSDETRKKISEKSKGRKHTSETIEKMRVSQQKPPLSEETKKKLSISLQSRSEEDKANTKKIQLEKKKRVELTVFDKKSGNFVGKYSSINECCRLLELATTTVNRIINKKGISNDKTNYTFQITRKTWLS